MNKVQMYISLDVCRPGLQETVYVTGGDKASRELCISLNVGGVPLDMQSGEVTAAYYSMINNSPVLGECRLEGGRIIHELTATECANTHTANIPCTGCRWCGTVFSAVASGVQRTYLQ